MPNPRGTLRLSASRPSLPRYTSQREPLKYSRTILPLILAASITGCSTGTYLRPESAAGRHTTVNPSCPGALEVIEFSPQILTWVSFRVYATPPERYSSHGTELRIHVGINPRVGINSSSSYLFQNEETKKLIKERRSASYTVTATEPVVTVTMPGGNIRKIPLPMFEKAFDARNNHNNYWAPGIQISPSSLDDFTVVFPDIYVNGEKINVAPIHFKLDQGRYTPVLNC